MSAPPPRRNYATKIETLVDAVVEQFMADAGPSTIEVEKCQRCGNVVKPYYRTCPNCEGIRNRDAQARLRELIREIKSRPPRTADEERNAEKRLVSLGHPAAQDFLRAITNGGGDL